MTRRATVLWMGLDRGAEALADLAGVVEEVVVGVGFEPEDRPFRAHLTLARIRPPQSVDDLVAELQTPPIEWRADHLTVFRSHLGRGGARYEVLDRLDL